MKAMHHIAPLGLAVSLSLGACSGAPDGGAQAPQQSEVTAETSAQAGSLRDVSITEASALVSGGSSVVVLDVRTPEEFADGHIEGAVNVDFLGDDFAEQLSRLDPAATYVLHCKSGGRSKKALEVLKEQSFTDVAHMTDGYDGWVAAEQAVTK
ncbi:MAG: rhodanese-like domain-containing protein [Pseudomonadota bacterium]